MVKLSGNQFQQYLDDYFLNHTYPCELGPKFDVSVSNHSRRIRQAIQLELSISNGTEITEELYRKERLYQDKLQAYDVMALHPNLLDRIRSTNGGPKRGRWTPEEEAVLLGEREASTPYKEIQEKLPRRTIAAMKDKYFRLSNC